MELFFQDDFSYKEINEIVPENPAAIRKTIQRFREDVKGNVL